MLCSFCNGSGKLLLLYSYVDCECQIQKDPTADEILETLKSSGLCESGRGGMSVKDLRKKFQKASGESLKSVLNELIDTGKIHKIPIKGGFWLTPKQEKTYHILGKRFESPLMRDDLYSCSMQELLEELLKLRQREIKLREEQKLKANKLISAAYTLSETYNTMSPQDFTSSLPLLFMFNLPFAVKEN